MSTFDSRGSRRQPGPEVPQYCDNLLQLYHESFLLKNEGPENSFASVTKASDSRHRANIRALHRTVAAEAEKMLGLSIDPSSERASPFRVTALAPHTALVPLAVHEPWQSACRDVYTLFCVIEGFGEHKGYYLLTREGAERFDSPVAYFVLATGEEGVEFDRSVPEDGYGGHPVQTYAAFMESRRSLRPFENPQANVVQEALVDALSRALGEESGNRALVSEHFTTLECTEERYVVGRASGKMFSLDIHLHRGEQFPIVVPPLELLADIRGLELP